MNKSASMRRPPPTVVVIGLMGTGKTTVAQMLSRNLGLPETDSDRFLRERYQTTALQTVVRHGVGLLHKREVEHLIAALSGPQPCVISAGASVVEHAEAREMLQAPFVVWLDANDDVLRQRMLSSGHRPHFDPAAIRERRAPLFAEVADLVVDVSVTPPDEVAKRIITALPVS